MSHHLGDLLGVVVGYDPRRVDGESISMGGGRGEREGPASLVFREKQKALDGNYVRAPTTSPHLAARQRKPLRQISEILCECARRAPLPARRAPRVGQLPTVRAIARGSFCMAKHRPPAQNPPACSKFLTKDHRDLNAFSPPILLACPSSQHQAHQRGM